MILGSWRQEMGADLPGLAQRCGNRYSNDAREIREEFCDYFTQMAKFLGSGNLFNVQG